jgi:hypothetical protein
MVKKNNKTSSLSNVRTGSVTKDVSLDINDKTNSILESSTFTFIIISITFITLIININAISWIEKLKKINCVCSEHWMRKYIEYYLYIIIPVQIINILIYIYLYSTNNMKEFNPKNTKNTLLQLYLSFVQFLAFFGTINIFIVIIFINRLKEINCYCSEDIKREVYYIYNIVLLSIICMYLFFAFIGAMLFIYNY